MKVPLGILWRQLCPTFCLGSALQGGPAFPTGPGPHRTSGHTADPPLTRRTPAPPPPLALQVPPSTLRPRPPDHLAPTPSSTFRLRCDTASSPAPAPHLAVETPEPRSFQMRPSSPTFVPASWLAPDPRRPRPARLQKKPLLASPLPGPSSPAAGPAPALHSPLPPPAAPARPHLAVRVDHRAEQLPGAAAAVHAHHAQDLQEAHAAQRRRGKDVALRARGDDRHRGHEHDEVCRSEGGDVTAGAEEPTRPASVPRPAGGEQPGRVRCGQGRPCYR